MSECLIQIGQVKKAIELLDQARESFSDYPDIHYYAGVVYANENNWSKALECFTACSKLPIGETSKYPTEIGLDWRSRQLAGDCLLELGRTDEAAEFFQESLKLNHTDSLSFYNLASIWLEEEEPEQVRKKLSAFVDWNNARIQADWKELISERP